MKAERRSVKPSVAVISQVPPPRHGSTIMTLIFLQTLTRAKLAHHLVERRFSRTLDDVGRFTLRKLVSGVGLIFRVIRHQARYRPTVWVLFLTNRPASFLVDWVITEVLSLFRQPIVHYIHTVGFQDLARRNRVLEAMVRRSLRAADRVICLGPSLTDDVAWAASKKIDTIPNTPLRTQEVPSPAGPEKLLLFLSNLLAEKGAQDFIECAIAMCRRGSTASFIVAGPAPDRDTHNLLSEMINASGYGDRIKLIGSVDESQKYELYACASALIFPSRYRFEAQPLTIVEAFSAGLPVVAYDTGGIQDLVISGETGDLVPQGAVDLLRKAAEKILDDPAHRDMLSRGARRHFSDHLSREAYEKAWLKILDRYFTVDG